MLYLHAGGGLFLLRGTGSVHHDVAGELQRIRRRDLAVAQHEIPAGRKRAAHRNGDARGVRGCVFQKRGEVFVRVFFGDSLNSRYVQ